MKTIITKKILGLALSVFSIAAVAQCPTITNINAILGANGTATLSATLNGTVSPILTTYYWGVTQNNGFITNSTQSQAELQFPANGRYLVCFQIIDSLSGCAPIQYCDSVFISNMLPTTCNASFTSYIDSNCVTHFVNSSTGNNLTYKWYDINNGYVLLSTAVNPTVTLANGTNGIVLQTYSSGQFCDTMTQYINVNCTNNPANTCNASFIMHTDSNCVTHLVNYSTGNNLSYYWSVNGINYSSQDLNLNLAVGSYTVILNTYSGGVHCDSSYQYLNVTCSNSNTNTPCQASFYTYTDSSCVTHFVNTSTGAITNSNWWINGSSYNVTSGLSLTNGTYTVGLANYSTLGMCDTTSQMITVSCGSGTTTPGCQANASFYVFADSTNAGNYFAYNYASGTGALSYAWDFGDTSPISSQQYPFHQYAVPGQYIICLTVTATSGTTTCSDTYCDSSSVQRIAAGFQMNQFNVIPQTVTGVKQTEKEIGLIAFPNPIADELTIEATTTNDNKLTFVLVDALGRLVLTGNLNNSKTTINTSNLEKGFYSLSVTNEKGSSVKTIKLVK